MLEQDIFKIVKKIPYPFIALGIALIFTAAAYLFVLLAKFLYEIPQKLDIPWIFVFLAAFLILIVRNRIKVMRADQNPAI